MTIVTLTTDFGTVDGYVAEMKGVIVEHAPSARLMDVTHEIEPGDVRSAAWTLSRIWPRYPEGTVHLAVVDPGVGSERDAVAVEAEGRWLVAPDNGLVTRVARVHPLASARALSAARVGLEPLSDTFHGRDLFAPAAAHLAAGEAPAGLGPGRDPGSLVTFPVEEPVRSGGSGDGSLRIAGSVVHVDRFGNLITNVPSGWLPPDPVVEVGDGRVRGLAGAYADVEPGEALLTRGSGGTLEISVRGGRASVALGAGRGDRVVVGEA